MASYDELVPRYRLFMLTYPYSRFRVRDNPVATLAVGLDQARVALVTTGGLLPRGASAFDRTVNGGDVSFREIGVDSDVRELIEDHKSDAFDHAGVAADRNLVFPLDRFRELRDEKRIGSLNDRHLSFMGSIIDPRRLIDETAPAAARVLKADGVDAVFLTPV